MAAPSRCGIGCQSRAALVPPCLIRDTPFAGAQTMGPRTPFVGIVTRRRRFGHHTRLGATATAIGCAVVTVSPVQEPGLGAFLHRMGRPDGLGGQGSYTVGRRRPVGLRTGAGRLARLAGGRLRGLLARYRRMVLHALNRRPPRTAIPINTDHERQTPARGPLPSRPVGEVGGRLTRREWRGGRRPPRRSTGVSSAGSPPTGRASRAVRLRW
jgi:hypothetical protein